MRCGERECRELDKGTHVGDCQRLGGAALSRNRHLPDNISRRWPQWAGLRAHAPTARQDIHVAKLLAQ